MISNKDLFLRMREDEYFAIPEQIREQHLRTKIYSESVQDFDYLMEDETYSKLHKEYKEVKNQLEERAYQLREKRRNNN